MVHTKLGGIPLAKVQSTQFIETTEEAKVGLYVRTDRPSSQIARPSRRDSFQRAKLGMYPVKAVEANAGARAG
jgi:hypothetical protein